MWKDERRWVTVLYILGALLFFIAIARGYAIAGRQVHITHDHAMHQSLEPQSAEDQVAKQQSAGHQALRSMNDGWILVHEDGTEEEITLPYEATSAEAHLLIKKDVTGYFNEYDDTIRFDNYRQGVIVKADDTVIYEVNTTSLVNQVVFTDYVLVTLPDAEQVTELSIEFVNKINGNYYIPEMIHGSYANARNEIISNDLGSVILLSLLFMCAFLVYSIYIFCKAKKINSHKVFDLLLFILTAIVWGYTDSYLPTFTNIPQEVIGIACYLSIMSLPIPMAHFVWLSTQKKSASLWLICVAGAINVILQVLLSMAGIFQLQSTFYTAHILIIAVVVASFISIMKVGRKMFEVEAKVLFGGIVVLAVTSFASLIMYWMKGGMYYRNSMLLGTIIFSIILGVSVVIHYLKRLEEDEMKIQEHILKERLSMFDPLTGLPNRRSFENKLDEIDREFDSDKDAILVMLDVNGLKMVNDQYGHNAGDDLIVSTAKVLEKTYGNEGNCFRIGGDEFVVILTDLSVPMSTYEARFLENVAEINAGSRWKLSVASGFSHLTHVSGCRLSISDWKQEADINMYRNKVTMTGGHNREIAKDLKDIINCVVTTVEAKDPYTAAHSNRVRELSYCIADKLGVSDSTIQNIEIAAQLHDIGKIGVPDHILQKAGKLSPDEYEKIKLHAQIGANIIGQAKGMQDIAHIVLHHHERWDGKGYPDSLSKEDIPLESRIIAIADSIDAVTSKRIYRDSMSLDVCRSEIEKNVGIMYDPAVAQIVLEYWNDIVDIVMKHPKYLIQAD